MKSRRVSILRHRKDDSPDIFQKRRKGDYSVLNYEMILALKKLPRNNLSKEFQKRTISLINSKQKKERIRENSLPNARTPTISQIKWVKAFRREIDFPEEVMRYTRTQQISHFETSDIKAVSKTERPDYIKKHYDWDGAKFHERFDNTTGYLIQEFKKQQKYKEEKKKKLELKERERKKRLTRIGSKIFQARMSRLSINNSMNASTFERADLEHHRKR